MMHKQRISETPPSTHDERSLGGDEADDIQDDRQIDDANHEHEIVTVPVDVVVTTNKDAASCRMTIQSICAQRGCEDIRLLIVCDRVFATMADEHAWRDEIVGFIDTVPYRIVSQHSDNLSAGIGGASGARNRALAYMRDDAYVVRLDDDILCQPTTVKDTISFIQWYESTYHTLCAVSPILYYRNTSRMEIGFSGFSYRIGWPLPIHVLDWRARLWNGVSHPAVVSHGGYQRYSLSSVGGSFFAARRQVLCDAQSDERMPYVYEDLDMSARAVHNGVDLVVPLHITSRHMQRDKTHLEQAFLSSHRLVLAKAKHRRRFAWSHSRWWERLIYCCVGVHLHTIRLMIKLLRYRQFHLLAPFLLGHRQGLLSIVRDPSRSPVVTSSISATDDTKTSVTN